MSYPESSGAMALAQPQNLFSRVFGIFTNPRETMADIVTRPTWLVPLIILMLTSAVSVFFLQDLILENALDDMSKRPNVTQEQMAAATPMIKIFTWIVPLFVPIINLIVAALFLFIGNVILGGESNFRTAFAVTCWSGLVTVVSSIVNVPLMLNRGEMRNATSLNFMLPWEENQSPLFFVLSQIDIFYLWWLVVLGLGFAAAYKLSTKKGITTVFVAFAVYVAVVAGFKAIF